jgi:hypothetical protein
VGRLAGEARAVGIAGAGRHVSWLLLATGLRRAPVRAVLVPETSKSADEFCGFPVRAVDAAPALGLSHVLVSVPEPGPDLAAKLALLEAGGITVVRPFPAPPAPSVAMHPLVPAPTPDGTGEVPLVAYLARYAEGPEPVERFISSYRANPERMAHQFVIIFKGFPSAGAEQAVGGLLKGLAHREVRLPDTGYDIGAYLEVFRRFRYPAYLFVGSFCELKAPGWLTAMERCLRTAPRAGVVAASGSWASGLSSRFPNFHVRTSAFLMTERVLRDLHVGPLRSKHDAHEFEHGGHGLTRQILAMGLEPYVVGRDGRGWRKEEWPDSATFFSHEQENLLVSDNWTDMYSNADSTSRGLLAQLAWGS